MAIDREDVKKIATLANLDLTPEETDRFTGQMAAIVSYFDKLNELDTTTTEPMMHSTLSDDPEASNRPDEPHECPGQETALSNAPSAAEGHFRVPRVL